MRKLAALIALFQMLLLPAAVVAQGNSVQSNDGAGYVSARTVSTISWTEEWDPVAERWVRVADRGGRALEPVTTVTTNIVNGKVVSETVQTVPANAAARYAVPMRAQPQAQAIAHYGPFRVIGNKRAAIIGTTGPDAPAQFDAMLRDFPRISVLEMVDAGGTSHDIANLELGRRIRAAGLNTHVPEGGSARSGGVELFLAGQNRTMAPGAQFAVHSWLDNYGRQPDDFAPDAPENRLYLDYYIEMGMSESRAREFYAMTNSVPHSEALWLRADDMQPWIAANRARRIANTPAARPVLQLLMNVPALPQMPITPVPATPMPITPASETIATNAKPMIDYSDVTRFTFADATLLHVAAS
ncbi:hypothetical protein FGU71_07365 [Erythrobacter insulae]|uniref:Alpha/beta hydrolase n=1 Tax=Erythrobacter insulae TaxID=2584124 RepID=A0A547PC41_9SPHN|nr:hypothetical protein [Erythrobacter insulae]TRD11703.1 hypothetical protein FGU71_07365 [Erythrobacter insulae]